MSTFLEIANNIAVKVRLPNMANCFSSSDRNAKVIKLAIINGTKRNVFRAFDWSFLCHQETFTTVSGVGAYDLPDDFDRFIPMTNWNTVSQRRITGPIHIQKWALYKNDAFGVSVLDYVCRMIPGTDGELQMKLEPVPSAAEEISYWYIKNGYVWNSSQQRWVSEFSGDDDTTMFDTDLVEQAGLYRTLRVLGLDYGEEKYEFEQMLSERTAHDGGSDALDMAGPNNDLLFLGVNTPLTGLG